MEKHLLLTVGDDPSAFYAVRFACNFLRGVPDVKLTLFYVTPRSASVYFDDRDVVDAQAQCEGLAEVQRIKGAETLKKSREMALSHGFGEDAVFCKVQKNIFGTVQDIVQEAEAGLYDAVVLGRRGLSRFEELIVGSVTKTLLTTEISFPIWVCKRPIIGYKDILLCVDGSEGARRVADHVGFVVQNMPEVRVVILSVENGRQADAEAAAAEAVAILGECFIEPARMETRVVRGGSAAEAILKEAQAGKFGAVAVGRTADGKRSLAERKFMGSTSLKLLRELETAALWTC